MAIAIATQELPIRPALLDDVEAAVELFNTCDLADVGAAGFTVEDVRNEWGSPGFNPATDIRIVTTPAGQMVGYIEVWDTVPHVRVWLWGCTHPDYRGQGIGAQLVRWGEERARQAIAKAPAGARVSMQIGALSNNQAACDLFQAAGFTLVRRSYRMAIDLDAPPPAPQWPAGVTVRTFAPGVDDEATYLAMEDAFQDHWGYVRRPFEEGFARWQHFSMDGDFDPSLWFLAIDGGQIAGISLCRPYVYDDPAMGWVGTLGVRRPWRRRGLGMALLQHSFVELYQRGQRRVGLGVDASSLTGATRLYEKAGMRVIREYLTYEKELRAGQELSTQAL